MEFERALHVAQQRPNDESALSDLATAALAEAREDVALPLLRRAAGRAPSALLWQWTGLLERSLDEHALAIKSFARAAGLAPTDRSIAHGHARVALEAGLPAQELFERALRLSPGDGDVLLGYCAALFAGGKSDAAEAGLVGVLERAPLWTDGHVQLAQLRSMIGKKNQATASFERAIQMQPKLRPLWIALFRLLTQSARFEELDESVARARSHVPSEPELIGYEAIAAAELGDTQRADRLFSLMRPEAQEMAVIFRIRHLLRSGRVGEACARIDEALQSDQAAHVWPYAAIAWRLSADPRSHWLEGDLDRMVSIVDLKSALPDIPSLERVLRRLHSGKGEFLDQSVRGGSQTDGPLFTRIDPEIRALRSAIAGAVERHVQNLPAPDSFHPLLGRRRDRRTRFSGSWSVFLRGGGYHTNHVHPEGWISSALYIHLAEPNVGDPVNAGWLTIGEADTKLGVELRAVREIEPKVGRLVLFPSYMWHGTRPFTKGERLTVAFDVRQPI
ncbi:MAG TPA: putative 2OG-Fe(II) oxygenase [Sphingomicrobium sp.]|nr:putative 2OG-Fe(II) oxygenase [Sphingomicrobium sp.]